MAVIAICCEVLGPELLDSWLERGWLPNLERLRREGVRCRVRSETDLSAGAVWPTVFTGVNPGAHGQFFTHMQLRPGTYRVVKKYADDVPLEPFWAELSRAGLDCTLVDVPQTRPVAAYRGLQVMGWGGEYPAWPRSSEPRGLMREIVERFGEHPLVERLRVGYRPGTDSEHRRLLEDLLRGARAKAELLRWLFEQGSKDLFLAVFSETHWALHLLWDCLDESHPRHDPGRSQSALDMFRELTGTLDETIGFLRQANPEADLLVFSVSGMGSNCSGLGLLPEVLERIGMGEGSRTGAGKEPAASTDAAEGGHRRRLLTNLAASGAAESLKRALPPRLWDTWTRRILFASSGWARRRAFCLPNDYSGAIRVNLRGREPRGRVASGAEYEAVCEEITAALMELRHAESGDPVVRRVVRPQALYRGELVDELPDLQVVWTDEEPVHRVCSSRVGTIELVSPERRPGGHRPHGFLVAHGPRMRRGATLDDHQLLDLAPTVLGLLDVTVPSRYEGCPIPLLADVGGAFRWVSRNWRTAR